MNCVCCVYYSYISTSKGKNQYRLLHRTDATFTSNKETPTVCMAEYFGTTLNVFGLDNPLHVRGNYWSIFQLESIQFLAKVCIIASSSATRKSISTYYPKLCTPQHP